MTNTELSTPSSRPRRACTTASTSGTVETAVSGDSKPKRPSQRVRKADVGKLSFVILSMPTEVILRIMACAEPLTLLQLARSCTMFRRMLLCNSALPVWKQARLNVGMDWEWQATNKAFNEADWAVLVFCVGCTQCGKGKAVETDYVARKRCCPACKTGVAYGKMGVAFARMSGDELSVRNKDRTAIWTFKKEWLADKCWDAYDVLFEPDANGSAERLYPRQMLGKMLDYDPYKSFVTKSPYEEFAWEKDLPNLKAKLKQHAATTALYVSWTLGIDPDFDSSDSDDSDDSD